jgi:hypothetical protein
VCRLWTNICLPRRGLHKFVFVFENKTFKLADIFSPVASIPDNWSKCSRRRRPHTRSVGRRLVWSDDSGDIRWILIQWFTIKTWTPLLLSANHHLRSTSIRFRVCCSAMNICAFLDDDSQICASKNSSRTFDSQTCLSVRLSSEWKKKNSKCFYYLLI